MLVSVCVCVCIYLYIYIFIYKNLIHVLCLAGFIVFFYAAESWRGEGGTTDPEHQDFEVPNKLLNCASFVSLVEKQKLV